MDARTTCMRCEPNQAFASSPACTEWPRVSAATMLVPQHMPLLLVEMISIHCHARLSRHAHDICR